MIHLLTSNSLVPEDPSLTSPDWETRDYHDGSYGAFGIIDFTTVVEAQHVAVYSVNGGSALTMIEVVIYGMYLPRFSRLL